MLEAMRTVFVGAVGWFCVALLSYIIIGAVNEIRNRWRY